MSDVILFDRHKKPDLNPTVDVSQQMAIRDVHALGMSIKDLENVWESRDPKMRKVLCDALGGMIADQIALAHLLYRVCLYKNGAPDAGDGGKAC